MGISFSSSEWIAISFADENVSQGWLPALRDLLAKSDQCVHLIKSAGAPSIPLVVVRRKAFIYGAIDERFSAYRLAALHWVYWIYSQAKNRVLPFEGVVEHRCSWLKGTGWPSIEGSIVGLVELWNYLGPQEQVALLEQVISLPPETQHLHLQQLLNETRKRPASGSDPYRNGSGYNAREFWEVNTAGYVKWEVYQPDEPEIIALVERMTPHCVLELGCGVGRNARYFASADSYVGIDLSLNLLKRAVERQQTNSLGILRSDVSALSFADATFDLVFADSTIQHVPPRAIEQCIEEMLRVSARYIALIEYTRELNEKGTWFKQVHMFAHDYVRLLTPHARLLWRAETSLRVHPAKKEVFLFEKTRGGHG